MHPRNAQKRRRGVSCMKLPCCWIQSGTSLMQCFILLIVIEGLCTMNHVILQKNWITEPDNEPHRVASLAPSECQLDLCHAYILASHIHHDCFYQLWSLQVHKPTFFSSFSNCEEKMLISNLTTQGSFAQLCIHIQSKWVGPRWREPLPKLPGASGVTWRH